MWDISIYERFGFAVRNHRKKAGLTQNALAEKLKMSARTIQAIESGRKNPKFETIYLLCDELGISLDEVLFPNKTQNEISKTAIDFFKNKSETEIQIYIDLCKEADKLKTLSLKSLGID